MQKALDQMNLLLHKVISDITGNTGTKIIEAILNGERNPRKLALLRHGCIKASVDTIEKSLEGDYREEHLFVLAQEYDLYKFYINHMRLCDLKIEEYLKNNNIPENDIKNNDQKKLKTKKRIKREKGSPKFDLHSLLLEMTGVDLTRVDGLNPLSILKIISEVGTDMSKWKSEKHFSSWLGLSPSNRITGAKVKSSKTNKVVNNASSVFRTSAATMANSKSALGAFYRRIRGRKGGMKAITATAHKIAKIFYRMLKNGEEYVKMDQNYYEDRYKERIIQNLKRKAQLLGLEIKEIPIT